MSDRKDQLMSERTMGPLVQLCDRLCIARVRAAKLRLRRAELELKRTRVQLIPNEKSLLKASEFVERINGLTDQLRENRRRVGRLRSARDREIGVLLGANFTYFEIAKHTNDFAVYAGFGLGGAIGSGKRPMSGKESSGEEESGSAES